METFQSQTFAVNKLWSVYVHSIHYSCIWCWFN